MAKTWSPTTIARIRRATAHAPHIQRGDHSEWNWDYGAVWTSAPARTVRCVACDGAIAKGEPAYYAVHTESGPGAGWTASKRYLHRHDCLQEAA
jgi:hypothetical protein